ncbi:MAG: molecular chaperone DnaJ [Pseudomonadota bacterium]
MAKQDYYETLGVARDVDERALKAAFRKRAMQYHPDRNKDNPDAERRFKEVAEAYEVLKDPQRRAAYDQYGHAAFEGMNGARHGAGGFDFAASFSDIFDDLFGEFMGGGRGRGRSGARRGADLRYDMEITLEEAFTGVAKTITVTATAPCETCSGTGAEAGAKPETCPTCQGAGKLRTTQGFFMVERGCPTCQGAGRVIANPCKACHGQGAVRRDKTLSVKIPQGVESGTRIRLAGEGEAGLRGGPPGDLYIFLAIAPHKFFQRDRENLLILMPLAMTTAISGGDVAVPAIGGGKAMVKIPAGTQSGAQFRLRGKGMPTISGGPTGDMIVQVRVETPTNLNKRQKELMREFAAIEEETKGSCSPEASGFFAKVKEFWGGLTE